MTVGHQLPRVAAEYIAGLPHNNRKVRHLVARFHAWLEVKQVDTSEINIDLIDPFIQLPWTRKHAESTRFLMASISSDTLDGLANAVTRGPASSQSHRHGCPRRLGPSSKSFNRR
jgi:hypothetical protein